MTPLTLTKHLGAGDIVAALEVARFVAKRTKYAQLGEYLSALPESLQPQAKQLFLDVMSSYPNTLFGAPALFTYAPTGVSDSPALATPAYAPAECVKGAYWQAVLPVMSGAEKLLAKVPVEISPRHTQVAILVLQTDTDEAPILDLDWSDTLSELTPQTEMHCGAILPYPLALEYALAMYVSATSNGNVDTEPLWLGEGLRLEAVQAGVDWCRARQLRI